jgi:hypothetical protein
MNQLTTVDPMVEFEQTQKMCSQLMKTPHYAKLTDVGVFAIVQKAKSVGLNPLDALNGAMYFINGKVELTANTMNYLIRAAGHSIVKDPKSNDKACILHGKRKDNGDTWIASFSIDDAKKAGIYRNNWEKYTEDYLFARALTRLARQLFPDVIKGCYVEGEITESIAAPRESETIQCEVVEADIVSKEFAGELHNMLVKCTPEYQDKITIFCTKNNISSNLENMPKNLADRLAKDMYKHLDECKAALHQETEAVAQ